MTRIPTYLLVFPIVLFIGAAGSRSAEATSMTLDASARGHYEDNGYANGTYSGNNFYAGDCSGPVGRCYGQRDSRSWFRFDLSSVSSPVVGAVLYLDVPAPNYPSTGPGYASTSADSETFVLFEISAGNLATLGMESVSVWTDLGSGQAHGSHAATDADVGQTIAIQLNAAALASINAALGGDFAMGGAITTLNNVADDEYLFGSTGPASVSRLQLLLPEPSIAVLLALPMLLLGPRARRPGGRGSNDDPDSC